jgi:hypothetical protein
MPNNHIATTNLIKIIGSPFTTTDRDLVSEQELVDIYQQAFEDRVAPLYLSLYKNDNWNKDLIDLYQKMTEREKLTRSVLVDLADQLNQIIPNQYVIIKSIKPYPAIPNDTDVLILGNKKVFNKVLDELYGRGYVFHEWAPMQTTIYDSRGIGKIGKGKRGGTYYIDLYQDISTDYVCYLNKNNLKPYIYTKELEGVQVQLLRTEIEMAIILFHNIFPERTFQLEHFYLPLYTLSNSDFNPELFLTFVKNNKMCYAISSNLTLIATLHKECFGFVPEIIEQLLVVLGENKREKAKFSAQLMNTPYMFTPQSFFLTIIYKLSDYAFFKSLFIQAFHMLNPKFFLDVMNSLKRRLSEKGTYHLE